MQPRVTVITCVYNDELFVEQSIRSILNQTYSNFEYIIVDDGSTDATPTILAAMARTDNRLKLLSQANQGPAAARNTALHAATGEVIVIQDSDDISAENRIELQLTFIDRYDVITSFVELIDDDGEVIAVNSKRNDIVSRFLSGSNPLTHGSLMIRKSVLLRLSGYDPYYKISEDYDLLLRIVETDCTFFRVDAILYSYRMRKGSVGYTYGNAFFDRALINFKRRKVGLANNKTEIVKSINKGKHLDRIALAKFWCEDYTGYLRFVLSNFRNLTKASHYLSVSFALLPSVLRNFAFTMTKR